MPQTEDNEHINKALSAFFSGLPQELLSLLLSISRLTSNKAGETIFEEDSPGDGFYLIVKGKVKIYKNSQDGKEQILHIFGPGEPFGEVALFLNRGYPANAQALLATTTIFFPRDGLLRTISANPEMALGLLGVMAQRLNHFTSLLESIALKEVPARLAAFILELASGKDRAELSLTKSQLASLLGTTPETISRSLGRLKNSGLITEERPFIIIHDQKRLKQAAEGFEINC